MTGTAAGAVGIEADLELAVTAPDGRSTTAHVSGEGSNLRVTARRPDVLLSAVDRSTIGPLADTLDRLGVSVYVDGPGGRVAVLGSAASSRIGRLLTGSSNAAVHPSGAIPSAAASAIRTLTAATLSVALARWAIRRFSARRR